jgi:2-iminobutanoate/2-iminopropanoate deaminase
MKTIIATADAPPALGPYAQAVRVGDTVYVSGQLPLDPKTKNPIGGSIAVQTEQVLKNIRAILEEAEATMDDVVKITIYVHDLDDFEEINRVYAMFFKNLPPARSTIQAARLPKDSAIEMDAIAVVSGGYTPPDYY